MKILHSCPHLDHALHGVCTAVRDMSSHVAKLGNFVEVHTAGSGKGGPFPGVAVIPHAFQDFPRILRVSPSMKSTLRRIASQFDVIHGHCMWTMPTIYTASAAGMANVPLIVTSHGTFVRWSRDATIRWKRPVWNATHSAIWRYAKCLHATSEDEVNAFHEMGLRQPIAHFPLGIDVPDDIPVKRSGGGQRKLMFLGRVVEQKGVDWLLMAWRAVQDDFRGWDLHLVGPDSSGSLERMKRLSLELGCRRVYFKGPKTGAEKATEFSDAELGIAPSRSENFGIVVGEMLAHGIPVITTHNTPWGGINERNAGWCIDLSVANLEATLKEALRLSSVQLQELGRVGHDWVLREFSNGKLADNLMEVYKWLAGGGSMPSTFVTKGKVSNLRHAA